MTTFWIGFVVGFLFCFAGIWVMLDVKINRDRKKQTIQVAQDSCVYCDKIEGDDWKVLERTK